MAVSKRKTPKRKTNQQKETHIQLISIAMFTLGVFLSLLAFIRASDGWEFFHNILLGFFGISAFFLGPIIIYIAVMGSFDKLNTNYKIRIFLTFGILLLLSAAFEIFIAGKPTATGFKVIGELYNSGIALKGGGVFSIILGLPLLLLGELGAKIMVVLLLFLSAMILTKSTIAGIFRTAAKPVEKISQGYQELVSSMPDTGFAPPKRQAPRSSIDIPIDEPTAKPKTRGRPPKEKLLEVATQQALPSGGNIIEPVAELEEQPDISNALEEAPVENPAEDNIMIDDIINRVAQVQNNKATLAAAAQAINQEAPPVAALASPVASSSSLTTAPPIVPPAPIYTLPPVALLREPKINQDAVTPQELKENAQRLVDTLQSFGVQTRIIDISRGPAVTRYELQPSAGVKISKITNLADDIALNLATAGVRIEAPIPNKAAVGIEVPNKNVSPVALREVIDSSEFRDAASKVTVSLGRDISGNLMVTNIAKMPHLLIAGSTGSGKSVCINSIIMSLLFKAKPDEVKLLLIDPKVVELGVYNGLPHLVIPVVTDPKKAAGALGWAVTEMLNRYKLFAAHSVRDIDSFNRMVVQHQEREEAERAKAEAEKARLAEQSAEDAENSDTPFDDDEPLEAKPLAPAPETPKIEKLPHYVIVVDELADLMMAAPSEVEDSICRLAQMARAAGMHLIIATQRPSVDVITGVIKANIPSRIAFAVSSQIDSRTILDMGGAEKLLGMGDMLFSPVGSSKPIRVQGCYVSDDEIERVLNFIKSAGTPQYDDKVLEEINRHTPATTSNSGSGGSDENEDEMIPAAIECVVEAGIASTSLLQRKLKLGYARAARIIDELEARGIVGPFEGSKPRSVLISKERYLEMKINQLNKE